MLLFFISTHCFSGFYCSFLCIMVKSAIKQNEQNIKEPRFPSGAEVSSTVNSEMYVKSM